MAQVKFTRNSVRIMVLAIAAASLSACAQDNRANLQEQLDAIEGVRTAAREPSLETALIATHITGVMTIPRAREHVIVDAGSIKIANTWTDSAASAAYCLP